MPGYKLNNITCSLDCAWPCADCLQDEPSNCTRCFYGWTYSSTNNSCVPDTSCNSQNDCSYCPVGYARTSTSASAGSATCSQCSAGSNCQRCSPSDLSSCTSCYEGAYLNNSQCTSCPTGCASCLSSSLCLSCQDGYVAVGLPQLISINNLPVDSVGPVTCSACESPCATCYNDPRTCLSCVSGYIYLLNRCVSDYNYGVEMYLDTTVVTLKNSYF